MAGHQDGEKIRTTRTANRARGRGVAQPITYG
jgi:hypothetical protein